MWHVHKVHLYMYMVLPHGGWPMAAGPASRLGSIAPGEKTGLRLSPHLAPSTLVWVGFIQCPAGARRRALGTVTGVHIGGSQMSKWGLQATSLAQHILLDMFCKIMGYDGHRTSCSP